MQNRDRQGGTEYGSPFSIAYLDSSQTLQTLADEQVMAVIWFGSTTQVYVDDPRQFTVGLPELGESGTVEVWYSPRPLQTGSAAGIRYACNEDVLLAHLLVEETDYPDLDTATYAAYRQILAFIHRQGYPYLLRVWNYFPDINFVSNGLERYRAFCQGRHRALAAELIDFDALLPAACAIGTHTAGLLIYFLAAKQPGVQIENPRQISAFHYPPRYGPKSPSFSRSILKTWGATQRHLYISGTASIVGHATCHTQDLTAQLQETLTNLEALLEQAGRQGQTPLRLALLKVYVRPAVAVTGLRDLIARRFGPAIPTLFLQADICRRNLLVEIEGIGSSG
jgi:chorismate lyase/3-hydroxybenzoate synthase